jgi:hypothetical protein
MKWFLLLPAVLLVATTLHAGPYRVVDTGQVRCYDAKAEIVYPKATKPFFGQDAQYAGHAPRYRDNRDGTITDLVTGLIWQKDPGEKKTLAAAIAQASKCRLGKKTDWRMPTIKELYSLILFSGTDPDPRSSGTAGQKPFIDTKYFAFSYGDPAKGERVIDSQFASATKYQSTTMRGDETVFGVNFADGRIKGYGLKHPRTGGEKTFYVLYVRGNEKYGKNDFQDNGDGTVTDRATGLTWMKVDSGHLKAGAMNWEKALAWAEGLTWAGKSDWRLPNAKELQSIVDYSRCPDVTKSAAIDPVFEVTKIENEAGKPDYPNYWTGTTHASLRGGETAVYFAFGRSLGYMRDAWLDVHGAGSQRSDPKSGDASRFPKGRGPQGDAIRIENHVRCVRGGEAKPVTKGPEPRKPVKAEPAQRPDGPAERFIRRLDKNGDGKVSKEEFDGPARHFEDFDANGDGYIDADEAPKGPPPGRRPR